MINVGLRGNLTFRFVNVLNYGILRAPFWLKTRLWRKLSCRSQTATKNRPWGSLAHSWKLLLPFFLTRLITSGSPRMSKIMICGYMMRCHLLELILNIFSVFALGLLDGIQDYFGIQNNNSVAGLLQTVFICSYMLLAPVFGFLGDRYKRKYIMAAGILVWSGTVFASTLLNKDVSNERCRVTMI